MVRRCLIAVVIALCLGSLAACTKGVDQTVTPDLAAGVEGGACLADGTCNAGLVCNTETQLCEQAPASTPEATPETTSEAGPVAGEEGGACLENSTCNQGFACHIDLCAKTSALCPAGMVFIKGGQFQMGDDSSPFKDEKPAHDVIVSDFCMDETEFTNGDKNASVFANYTWPDQNTGNCQGRDLTLFSGEKQPFICVNWYEARAICEQQGKRLPTEAEWEYAARGGSAQKQYGTANGDEPNETNACWSSGQNNNKDRTCNVMSYPANSSGLYDLAGNVWEWVNDVYFNSYAPRYMTPTLTEKPRVIRGGSWGNANLGGLRAANRHGDDPDLRSLSIGFRCVVSPQDSQK